MLEKPAAPTASGLIQKQPAGRAAVELRGVDRKAQRKMGEDLLDLARQPPPVRGDWSRAGKPAAGVFFRPGRARQFNRRGEKAMRRAAASEKGAVGAAGEEHRAPPVRSRLRLGAPRIGLRRAGLERGAILGERAGAANGIARAAEGRADVHQRLREIARPRGLARAPAPPPRSALARERSALQGRRAAPGSGRYCRRPAGSHGRRRWPRPPPRYRRRRPAARANPLPRAGNPPPRRAISLAQACRFRARE